MSRYAGSRAPTLLKDLQRLLKTLEADRRARLKEHGELDGRLKAEWPAAREAERTGETYETWRAEAITQAAVHWLLACVFLRFIEDNELVERPYLSGPGEGLALGRDRHESYFRAYPLQSDRAYLIACFREVPAGAPSSTSATTRCSASASRAMRQWCYSPSGRR